jgi:hypothetical protein
LLDAANGTVERYTGVTNRTKYLAVNFDIVIGFLKIEE